MAVSENVSKWSSELQLLSEIAITQPHAAYTAFTHEFSSRWYYLSRTSLNISNILQPLENIIRTVFIPTVTGRPPPNDSDRDMFALPARLGGLGLRIPTRQCDLEFSASQTIAGPLIELILLQSSEYPFECLEAQISAKSLIKQQRRDQATQVTEELKKTITPANRKVLELAS